eukprot:TRINITY_DN6294_c0_g1_i1.p3 TRINITY_DN6294_c0_g1~~TRINITY_DN6294_c0_g1_i1.p3  ORF type:complete len:135 (+),score=28.60 TRINITY_DN6294_c0_g1_i1:34-438(+)
MVIKSKDSELLIVFFFQAEDGIRDFCLSRGLGDVYKRQQQIRIKTNHSKFFRRVTEGGLGCDKLENFCCIISSFERLIAITQDICCIGSTILFPRGLKNLIFSSGINLSINDQRSMVAPKPTETSHYSSYRPSL